MDTRNLPARDQRRSDEVAPGGVQAAPLRDQYPPERHGPAARAGTPALDDIFPVLYQELRELAHRHRSRWQGNRTLNTTALVHEAYLKLARGGVREWDSEAHFLATAAKVVRQILVNNARDRAAKKRGGGWKRVTLDSVADRLRGRRQRTWVETVLTLNQALERLAERSERQSRVVECRFFAGMTVEQTAAALGVSVPTVIRSWGVARAWLHRELGGMA